MEEGDSSSSASFDEVDDASTSLSEPEFVDLDRPQGRKRLRCEANWSRNKQKRRKDAGVVIQPTMAKVSTWTRKILIKKKIYPGYVGLPVIISLQPTTPTLTAT